MNTVRTPALVASSVSGGEAADQRRIALLADVQRKGLVALLGIAVDLGAGIIERRDRADAVDATCAQLVRMAPVAGPLAATPP